MLHSCPIRMRSPVYPELHETMKYIAKKCGVRFQPPAMILIYENEAEGKSRQRIMPVRNFSKFSDCTRAAEQLKNNPRHKSYLEQVSLKQLEKLFVFLRGSLQGQSLAETMEQIQRETTIDPEEDLNKLDDRCCCSDLFVSLVVQRSQPHKASVCRCVCSY